MAEQESSVPPLESLQSENLFKSLILEIVSSPLNLILVAIISILVYKIIKSHQYVPTVPPPEPTLPKIRKDFTIEELKKYDGTQPDGRVLLAVNGNVYDVTKGKRFYGPGGPYASFGGRDASRGLATFQVSGKDEYDDLSDLNTVEMESVREWEAQMKEKYDLVGRLLRPGEEPTNYSEEEDEEKDKNASGDKPKEE